MKDLLKTLRETQKLEEADQQALAQGQAPVQNGQQAAGNAQSGSDAQALAKAVQDAVKAAIEPLQQEIQKLAQTKEGSGDNNGGQDNKSGNSNNNSGSSNGGDNSNSGNGSGDQSSSGSNNSGGGDQNNGGGQKQESLFNRIYNQARLSEGSFGDWHSKQVARAKKEPTIAGKVGKYLSNILFDGDKWDDISEGMIEYIDSAKDKTERIKRVNEISSVFRKFDGRKDPLVSEFDRGEHSDFNINSPAIRGASEFARGEHA